MPVPGSSCGSPAHTTSLAYLTTVVCRATVGGCIGLRVCYAMSDTDKANADTRPGSLREELISGPRYQPTHALGAVRY
eukprot:2962955-Rhodomonas_salina.3